MRSVEEKLLACYRESFLLVVAEAISHWLQDSEGIDIGLLLRGIHTAGSEWHGQLVAGILGSLLDARATSEDDEVGERDFLAAGLDGIEFSLDAFKGFKDLGELLGLVDFPIFLGSQANAAAIGSTALVRAAECGGRCPCSADEFGNRESRCEDFAFERGDIRCVDERMVHCGNRVLPDEFFCGDIRSEVARAWAHIAVRELEPSTGEGVRKLVGVFHEAA